jgi:hypothetical protein
MRVIATCLARARLMHYPRYPRMSQCSPTTSRGSNDVQNSQPVLRLSSILAQDTAPLTSNLLYRVYEATQNPEEQRKRVTASADAAPLFRLPVGRYYVTVEYRGANARKEVEVTAGQVHEIKLEMKMP